MIGVLVFANWGEPQERVGFWHLVYTHKWLLTSIAAASLGAILILWFKVPWIPIVGLAALTTATALLFPDAPLIAFVVAVAGLSIVLARGNDEARDWLEQSWGFAKQIMPLLFAGVLVAGLLLGRPGNEGLIPSHWISEAVGGNSIAANLYASLIGAFMYFATLTEVPILQGLMGSGMGEGPALALLLAGPALSLPNMLVIRSVIGTQKTIVYVLLVVVASTIAGLLYGSMVA
jgi:hypothetical protein